MAELDYAAALQRMTHSMALSRTMSLRDASHNLAKHVATPSTRPARVEKVSSRNSSPKKLTSRRKTIGTSEHQKPVNATMASNNTNLRSSLEGTTRRPRASRPLSWHPSMQQSTPLAPVLVNAGNWVTYQPPPNNSDQTSTGMGYPCYQQTLDYSMPTGSTQQFIRSLSWQPPNAAPTFDPLFNYSTSSIVPMYGGNYYPNMAPVAGEATSQPLPTAVSGHAELVPKNVGNTRDDQVLVGLGLYDTSTPPTPELSSSRHPSTTSEQFYTSSQGKGLKLEETWQPQALELPNDQYVALNDQSPVSDDAQLPDLDLWDPEYFHHYDMSQHSLDPSVIANGHAYWDQHQQQQQQQRKATATHPAVFDAETHGFPWPVDGAYNSQWMS